MVTLYLHFIYHLRSILHGLIRTHKWPAPNVSGFITQLVRASDRKREVTGSNPVEVLTFSGFYMQLLKLRSLPRWYSLLDFKSAVNYMKHFIYIFTLVNKVYYYSTTIFGKENAQNMRRYTVVYRFDRSRTEQIRTERQFFNERNCFHRDSKPENLTGYRLSLVISFIQSNKEH